ncbi:MAG: inorganic phosphate transporter [Kiritimatiellae bacterium]|nr:inorganic phosphate transporter [Verrucomicrobiota bacterium]MBU4285535.1 inorganic phosphate transporter [Verrucomicrobiota bacterium]MBU4366565.1 inorganic phosphate transporter [Verrucomicrobiota bacterium]MCG2661201.1 inorganic phosphate transporter [Kiritimatiellia bacterium]
MMEHLLLFVALAVGFYMAWNIGANDVANAFGTSVGSGALTFRRALLLAAIFEFSGAFFVGSHVANTIRGEIIQPVLFQASPMDFAVGMLAALVVASLWLHLATYFGQPVSTTHAIIGAVIGFGVVAHGPDSIQWYKLIRIAASWFVSPLAGALLGYLLYSLIRKTVLASRRPIESAKVAVPIGVAAVVLILVYSILNETLPRLAGARMPSGLPLPALALGASVIIAAGAGWLGRRLTRRRTYVVKDMADEFRVVERWFGRLQIITACYIAFAHGANDVANAIAPIAGILNAVQGKMTETTTIPAWILAFGGLGIVIGLATYGHKVIEAVGRKITEVTPTRGFAAEFGTATTVLVCSLMGLPISTTFVLVGAVMGVGFARGFGAIDLKVVRRIFMSWVITIPVSALLAALIYFVLKHTLALT